MCLISSGIVAKRTKFAGARESRGARGEARHVSSLSWVVIFKRARSPADIRTQQNVALKTPFNIIMYDQESIMALGMTKTVVNLRVFQLFLLLFVFVFSRSVSVFKYCALSVCLLQLFPLNSYWFFGLSSRSHWLE